MLRRRGFLAGLVAALAAPAIVRTPGLLMPIKRILLPEEWEFSGFESKIPLGQIGDDLFSQLCAVTPRAFVPRLFVDIYRVDPLLGRIEAGMEMAA